MEELYYNADILITNCSSILFDIALTDKSSDLLCTVNWNTKKTLGMYILI